MFPQVLLRFLPIHSEPLPKFRLAGLNSKSTGASKRQCPWAVCVVVLQTRSLSSDGVSFLATATASNRSDESKDLVVHVYTIHDVDTGGLQPLDGRIRLVEAENENRSALPTEGESVHVFDIDPTVLEDRH